MQQDTAVRLIGDTFNQPFDERRFAVLAGNLLNEVDASKAFESRHGPYVPQAFREHVRQYKRPFVYKDAEGERLDVLVVRLQRALALDRARTMQRNFIAWYLKQDHDQPVEAALVAFYHDDVPDWRFSLVRLEYGFGDEGLTERLTPARRYSFLVGPNEPTHTAEKQLLPLLRQDQRNPTIDDIAAAFQVEVVSRQFFEAYRELFLRLVEALDSLLAADAQLRADFARAEVDLPGFAKKLLGQIVFLYFVQKKGWLGVAPGGRWGEGPRDFLRRLFEKREGVTYDNFYNDVLEPLFYRALAVRRPDDLFSIGGYTCQIPFLNGGLFEPMGNYDWQNTQLLLPNRLFSGRQSHGEGGDGILDVFDRYNFTVREEEPLEKEVAVDPEMLGKVFENLLEVQDRKSKGAFYTPREIVHYMCQESLINYLDTAVNQPEPDPRIPREDLAALVRRGALALQQDAAKEAGLKAGEYVLPQNVRHNAALLDAALADIKLCDPAIGSGAFPVGMLHEIVQARLALATYVEGEAPTPYALKRHAIQESIYGVDIDLGAVEIAKLRLWLSLVVDEESYDDIQPLPNLDYKIVQGNSLLGVERNLFNNDLYIRLDGLKRRYFEETHRQEKLKLRERIDQLIELITGDKTAFDFEVYFHEVFAAKSGFDVVIGNPPYGAELTEDQKDHLKEYYDYLVERIRNSFLYFVGKSYEIARISGTICLIIPNEFLFQIYMTKARKFLLRKTTWLFAINLGENVFEAIVPSCIVAFEKTPRDKYQIPVADLRDSSKNELAYQLQTRLFPSSTKQIILDTPNAIVSFDVQKAILVRKLSSKFSTLESFTKNVANGISTGFNDVYCISLDTVNKFGIESTYLRPCLRGEHFHQYYCPSQNGELLLYITRDFDRSKAPNTYQYLLHHQDKLMQKSVEKKKGIRPWHILFRSRNPQLFVKPKIVVRQTADRIIAALDDVVGYHCIDSVNVVLLIPEYSDCYYYFVGLLNSSLIDFFYREISQERGRVLAQVKPSRVKQLPIRFSKSDPSTYELASLAKTATQLKQENGMNFDVRDLQRQMNEIVYQLYDLAPSEIRLIEENT